MINRIAILAVLSIALLAVVAAPRAEAAVPTAVVRFEANTAYEQSLEGFISSFTTSFFSTYFGALQQRQEDFEKTFLLGQIEAAREDVNKLVFDTLRELKEGALGGVVVGKPSEAQTVIKGMGFRTPPEIAESSFQCASGAYLNGQCLVVKREGRIVTNVDYYLYEEPTQKARDYANCYYNLLEWRQANDGFATYSILSGADPNSPSPVHIRDSILQLDLQKISILADLQRTERGLQNSPPVSWYRGGDVSTINWDSIKENGAERDKLIDINKCDIVLRNITCRDATGCFNASRLSDLVTYDPTTNAPNDNLRFIERNYLQQGFDASFLTAPPAELLSPDFPTVKVNVGTSPGWNWQLIEQARNPMNTLSGLREKVMATVQRIVTETHESRKAQFVAGQGIRPETYLIGWPDANAKAPNLRGKYYFIDTENIISPSFILLAKVRAAVQAQFDLAQKAYKYPPEANVATSTIPFIGFESNPGSASTPRQLTIPTLTPTIDKLPAPFEDFSSYLNLPSSLVDNPAAYAQSGAPNTRTKTPNTNYLNKFFKEVLQLHERSFGDVLALWFTDEASFFQPRQNVSQFFQNPAALASVSSALETSISRLNASITELENAQGIANREQLLAAAREARSRLEESRNHLRAGNSATTQTIYGNVLEADLRMGLVERGLAGAPSGSGLAGFQQARTTIGTGSPAFIQLERAAAREQVNYALETANQARTILGTVPGSGTASAEVGRAISILQQTDNLIRQPGAINTVGVTNRTNEAIGILRNATGIVGQAGAPASGTYQALGRIQTGIFAIERAQNVLAGANRVTTLIASGDPLSTLAGISQALNILGSLQNLFSGFGLRGILGL